MDRLKNVIMLDVDGVLNSHFKLPNGYCTIDTTKMQLLNQVCIQGNCELVISSAWRYLILSKSMTLQGFKNFLMTYGLFEHIKVRDYLSKDVDISDPTDRAKLVKDWLFRHHNFTDYLILDDLDLGFSKLGLKFYQTKGDVGLTAEDASAIVKILNKEVRC